MFQNGLLFSIFDSLYACSICIFYFFSYFIYSRTFHLMLSSRSLIQSDLESQFIVNFQLSSLFSQDPLLVLNYRWSTHPPVKGMLPPIGTEPRSFRYSASKVAGLQVHAITLGWLVKLDCGQISHKRRILKRGACQREALIRGNTVGPEFSRLVDPSDNCKNIASLPKGN